MAEPEPKDGAESGETEGNSFLQSWGPILAMMLLMPVVAYVMASYILVPKLEAHARAAEGHTLADGTVVPATADGHTLGENQESEPSVPALTYKSQFKEIYVNLRYQNQMRMLTSFTAVSDMEDFPKMVNSNRDMLTEQLIDVLEGVTVKSLQMGGRGGLKTNLMETLNAALQTNAVKDLYFTELAMQ